MIQLEQQTGPAVWRPTDFASTEWCYELADDQRQELVDATRRVARAGATVHTLGVADFHLPLLEEVVRAWQRDLTAGRGFVVIRGFPVESLSNEELALAYVGLGSQLGTATKQNRSGDLITPIGATGAAPPPSTRRFRTRKAMGFHNDGVDFVGLLCVRPGQSGGASRLVSSGEILNQMQEAAPNLVTALFEPVAWDLHSDDPDGEPRWGLFPPVRIEDGTPRIDYIGWDIRDAQQLPDVPRLTPTQQRAMNLLESTVARRDLQIEMTFDSGDLQLINDRSLLHARDSFEDVPPPAPGRLLLRLWLTGR